MVDGGGGAGDEIDVEVDRVEGGGGAEEEVGAGVAEDWIVVTGGPAARCVIVLVWVTIVPTRVFPDGSKTPKSAHEENGASMPSRLVGTAPRKLVTCPSAEALVNGTTAGVGKFSATGDAVAQFGATLSDTTVEMT